MHKPSLAALWRNFPDHDQYKTLKDLYEHLGGTAEKNIYSPGFGPEGNGCASRMSVALNASGAPINGSLVPKTGRSAPRTGSASSSASRRFEITC